MTAKLTWATSDEMSLANMNATVDGLKQSGVLVYVPEYADAINPAGTYPSAPNFSLPIHPVQGAYLVLRYYSHHDGGAGTFTLKFELESFSGREVLAEEAETETSETFQERKFDLTALTTLNPGGCEAKLNIYIKRSGGTSYFFGYPLLITSNTNLFGACMGDIE